MINRSPDEALSLAKRRGRAFQLTNILRDVAEDFDRTPSRVYLPLDSLRAHGLTPQDLRNWSSSQACGALVRKWADIAANDYEASDGLERYIDPNCLPALRAMTQIYRGLLQRITENPEISVTGRARVPRWKKAKIAAIEVINWKLRQTIGKDAS